MLYWLLLEFKRIGTIYSYSYRLPSRDEGETASGDQNWSRYASSLGPSILFPQLQLLEAKGRQKAFPAAILPASPVSDGQSGVGDGAGPGNRRAGVYKIGSFFPSPRWCLPSVVVGVARFRRGVVLCGMVFLAASARRWRWRRRGITSPSFFLAPVRLCSSLTGEVGEIRFGA